MSDRELYEEVLMDLAEMKVLLRGFFVLLDRTEETDDGRVFHPNVIRSCRALDAEKLEQILSKLKNMREG